MLGAGHCYVSCCRPDGQLAVYQWHWLPSNQSRPSARMNGRLKRVEKGSLAMLHPPDSINSLCFRVKFFEALHNIHRTKEFDLKSWKNSSEHFYISRSSYVYRKDWKCSDRCLQFSYSSSSCHCENFLIQMSSHCYSRLVVITPFCGFFFSTH